MARLSVSNFRGTSCFEVDKKYDRASSTCCQDLNLISRSLITCITGVKRSREIATSESRHLKLRGMSEVDVPAVNHLLQ
jgi:hypothetical protein